MTFVEWLGFRSKPNYADAKYFGLLLGVLTILIGLAIAFGGAATLIQFLAVVVQFDAEHEAIRNIGLLVVAVLGAPFVFWRAMVAQKQADTAEQSHITDQINKAVAGLGADKTVDRIGRPITVYAGHSSSIRHLVEKPNEFVLPQRSVEVKREYVETFIERDNEPFEFEGTGITVKTWEHEYTTIEWQNTPSDLKEEEGQGPIGDWSVFSESLPNIEVRIGSIYALERIAQDSPRDHIQIMEILTAYIRENSPCLNLEQSQAPILPKRPRTDIQAALDVIGRRTSEGVAKEHSRRYRLDLRKTDLSGANFSNGKFDGALFWGSRLEASNFRGCSLQGARLDGCLLDFADFFDADLRGARIDHSTINKLNAWNNSIMAAKSIKGISMAGADITAISHLPNKHTHTPTFGTKDTKLQHHIEQKRAKLSKDIDEFTGSALDGNTEIDDELRRRLVTAGFQFWSPFDSNDGLTGRLRSNLWNAIGIQGFPFED